MTPPETPPKAPMVTDAKAAQWATFLATEQAFRVADADGDRICPFDQDDVLRLLADRSELWAFVKLVRDTGAQHCMPLAEELLKRKEAGRA